MQLKIVIVGGGLGGLETALALSQDGHELLVLEAAPQFGEVGAGIRVPPNSSKLNIRWGVDFGPLKKDVSHGNRFLRWDNGAVIQETPLDDVEKRYGAPYYFMHRADFHKALLDAVVKHGVEVRCNARVVEYDYDGPRVKTADGAWHSADLVIAADGIKSGAREGVVGRLVKPRDSGDLAYRVLLPSKLLLDDPELAPFIKEPWAQTWVGPDAHFVAYPIRGGELYNIIVCCTAESSFGKPFGDEDWRDESDPTELKLRLQGWHSPCQKLIGMAKQFIKWKLCEIEPLDTWIHPFGKVVLLGDSAHGMLSYLAQGAAQCTEDAGTLRTALKVSKTLSEALSLYERQRIPRAAAITLNTRVHQEAMHVYDGPEQVARDLVMGQDIPENPIWWAYTKRRDWLFGHDAEVLKDEAVPWEPKVKVVNGVHLNGKANGVNGVVHGNNGVDGVRDVYYCS